MNALIDGFLKDSGAIVPKANPAYCPYWTEWRGAGSAKIGVEENRLVIESIGAGPYIVLRDSVNAARGSYALEFRMRSKLTGGGRIFWTSGAVKKFAKEACVEFPVQQDGAFHEYSIAVPGKDGLKLLRLDPGKGTGRAEIEWIRLKKQDGKEIKRWTFSKNAAHPPRKAVDTSEIE